MEQQETKPQDGSVEILDMGIDENSVEEQCCSTSSLKIRSEPKPE